MGGNTQSLPSDRGLSQSKGSGTLTRNESVLRSTWSGLLNVDENDVPEWLWKDTFIRRGFRPRLSWWGCLKSVFALHNETFNIWSHLIGSAVFAHRLYSRYTDPTWISGPHDIQLVGSTAQFAISAVAHTFCAHSQVSSALLCSAKRLTPYSFLQRACDLLFRLDRSGIALQFLTVSLSNGFLYYRSLLSRFVYGFFASALACGNVAVFSGFLDLTDRLGSRQLLAIFLIFFQMCLIYFPVVLKAVTTSSPLVRAIIKRYGGAAFLLTTTGALAYALHFPDRLRPGVFDMFGNGHNLMHVLVFISAIIASRGSTKWHWAEYVARSWKQGSQMTPTGVEL